MLRKSVRLPPSRMSEKGNRFNEILGKSIDATITELFSPNVLSALYTNLKEHYDVTKDELPYRLETMYSVLDSVFGWKEARTVERQIAKHLSEEFNIHFLDTPDCTLPMYIEKAKALG